MRFLNIDNSRNMFAVGIVLITLLAGCSARPGASILDPSPRPPRFTPKVEMLVATTRGVGDPANPFATSAERSRHLNYGIHTVSIPTHHKPGDIEWPDQLPPDPTRHFLTTNRALLQRHEFLDALRARAKSRDDGKVLVFVHGYNMLYQESVYWLGQIAHDSGFRGTPVLFAWPSQGKAPLYIADRESVTYSRDYFERLLLEIAALPEVREIDILAHSMGTLLTVETMRQASIKGNKHFGGKLHDVILASPDIDVNVFRTQLEAIGRLRRPMTVLVSGDDNALALSKALGGGTDRVGLITAKDLRAIEGALSYRLNVVDLTGVDPGDPSNHSKFARSGAIMAAIGHRIDGRPHSGETSGGVVQAVTDVGKSLTRVPLAIIKAGQ